MKLFVSISGAKFRDPNICNIAYKDMMKVKSVHFIGEKDWLKLPSQELTTDFENPIIIRHPQGHTVPRIGKWNYKFVLSYLLLKILQVDMKYLEIEKNKKTYNSWVVPLNK